jgi:hypothetical protein
MAARAIKLFALLMLINLLCVSGFAQQNESGPKHTKKFPKIRMILPRHGDLFTPGQQVTIEWETTLPKDLDITRCEQEIYLSLDGGKTLAKRITGHLTGATNRFTWTVPDLPTDNAVLMFRFGSETGRFIFEKSYLKKSTVFTIAKTSVKPESIEFENALNRPARAGEEIEINWQSSVANVDYYQIGVSYDMGAHFQPVARTHGNNYRWLVPADFLGGVIFQVQAHKFDGSVVSSLIDAEPMVLIQDK